MAHTITRHCNCYNIASHPLSFRVEWTFSLMIWNFFWRKAHGNSFSEEKCTDFSPLLSLSLLLREIVSLSFWEKWLHTRYSRYTCVTWKLRSCESASRLSSTLLTPFKFSRWVTSLPSTRHTPLSPGLASPFREQKERGVRVGLINIWRAAPQVKQWSRTLLFWDLSTRVHAEHSASFWNHSWHVGTDRWALRCDCLGVLGLGSAVSCIKSSETEMSENVHEC